MIVGYKEAIFLSDQKLISPLLDGFIIGDPISEHDGVRCCPAMREDSNEKYIVKIISVPSTQHQLDALLLTGAYPDAASAMEYFKEQTEGICKEADILKQLSKLQGFLPYENWQVVPMDNNRLGYEVYLLSPYKRSLEAYLKKHTMTHLRAVNLGIDLCAALSICRRAGFMFVDLKPSNIFLAGKREYRIGDLGFAEIDSLKFSALPSKYRSVYTAQELHDDLATLNPTADIYSVGMILYQIYNDGKLPFDGCAPADPLPSALNADYELSEIIQKAIDPNPRTRWQTPIEMGQALAAYLERNDVPDEPITPPSLDEDAPMEPTDEALADETAPDAETAEVLPEGTMTAEVSSMLAQADELISRELPEVVVPDAPELELPKPEPAPKKKEVPAPIATDYVDDEDELVFDAARPKVKRSWVVTAVLIFLLTLGIWGAVRFYNDYYMLEIDRMEISGKEDTISVYLRTEIDQNLLTVICTDTYGNKQHMPVVNGVAEFIGLNPDTMYNISVTVEGFHALRGAEPCSFTTSAQTKIIDYTAKTGTEDGSVILSFAVDGRDTQDWMIEYATPEEETKSVSFTGHMVAINGLTVGSTYTFNLIAPAEQLWIVGNTCVEYTASPIVVAEALRITGCVDGVLTARWNAPQDATVESWTVRCYSDAGYDKTIVTSDMTAEFSDIIADKAYTVEVTAAGMTQNARTYVSASPTTVTNVSVEASEETHALNVTWTHEGAAPEGGWLLLYTINGSDNHAVLSCAEPSATIEPYLPGVTYSLTIQAANGSTVFGGNAEYVSLATDPFDALGVSADTIQASLCPTPAKENWTYEDIGKNDYTSKYLPNANASLVVYSPERPDSSTKQVDILFVIRDAEGNVQMDLIRHMSETWNTLWSNRDRYCTLDIPAIPKIPGAYTIEVYFNNSLLIEKNLTILETE